MREQRSPRAGNESKRHSSVREAMQREEKKAAERAGGMMPFRFYQGRGEETEIVILDESMDKAFWRHEHNLKIGGKWGNHEPCIAEDGPCPWCDEGNRPALVVMLTCLVLRPYKNKRTGKTSQYTKMLLPIKRQQFPEFDRIEEIAIRKHGTLRGTCLLMFRKDEENSFSTGMPVANDDGEIINDWLNEKKLSKEFGHDAIKRDGKVFKKADEDLEVFDYKKLFPKPDTDAIREEHGIEVPGSRRANRRAEDDDSDDDGGSACSSRSGRRARRDEEDDADDIPDLPSKSRRQSARRAKEAEPDDDEDEDDSEEEAEEEAPRSRRRPSSPPAKTTRSRRAPVVEDDEEEDDDEEDEGEDDEDTSEDEEEVDDEETEEADEADDEDEDEEEEAPAPSRRRGYASTRAESSKSKVTAPAPRSGGRRRSPSFED